MRKVWISLMAVAALTVATALPAAAAVPSGKSCNNSWNWSFGSGPAITQPTVPSIPGNCATATPAKCNAGANTQCSKSNLSGCIRQMQAQLGNCLNGILGGVNCPTQSASCNQ